MVDKATARMLVYGALGTLALILLVAVYALATKGSLQSELEKKLDALREKEHALSQQSRAREEALQNFRRAEKEVSEERGKRKIDLERLEEARHGFEEEKKDREAYEHESERLRRKLWDKSDQQKLEDLEKKSEKELREELEKEGEEFFNDQKELGEEHFDDEIDNLDLEQEKNLTGALKESFEHSKKKGHLDAEALENLEEFGEQNEVYLDELERDVKKLDKQKKLKWKKEHRDLPKRMGDLVKDMDLHAEALRNKVHEKKFNKDKQDIDSILHDADEAEHKGTRDQDNQYAPAVKEMARKLADDEKRLLREFEQADEEEEDEAAKQLERDAEIDEVRLAHLEQLARDDKKLTPAQKKEKAELMRKLEEELDDVEKESRDVEKGLERRSVRQDAVKMAKAANRLSHEEKPLKHKKKAINDVNAIVNSEYAMLKAMNAGNVSDEQTYGRQMAEEAEELERDAGLLYDEAEAGDYDDLDDKLMDEQLAKELGMDGEEMEHDASGVEHDDHIRELHDEGEQLEESAARFGEKEKSFAKLKPVKEHAEALGKKALELGRLVGEQNWAEEAKVANQAIQDASELDHEAIDLEHEIQGAPQQFDKETLDQDMKQVKSIEEAAQKLRDEAKVIKEDVGLKADKKRKRLKQEMEQVEPLAQG